MIAELDASFEKAMATLKATDKIMAEAKAVMEQASKEITRLRNNEEMAVTLLRRAVGIIHAYVDEDDDNVTGSIKDFIAKVEKGAA